MASRPIIVYVKHALTKSSIDTGKMYVRSKVPLGYKKRYRITISGKQILEKYGKLIGFNHPNKKRDLKLALRSYKYEIYYKKGEIRKLMLDILEKDKTIKTVTLAEKLECHMVDFTNI